MARKFVYLLFVLILVTSCSYVHHPEPSYPPYLMQAHANARLAIRAVHTGDFPTALEKIALAQRVAPKDVWVISTLGYIFEKAGDIKKANYYYSESIKLNPHAAMAWNIYGAFLCRQGKFRDSIRYFSVASQSSNPNLRREALKNADFCWQKSHSKLG